MQLIQDLSEFGCVRRTSGCGGELQSWSGAVTHSDTNRHLDKYTDIPRTQSLLSLTLSLSARSAARPLSLSSTHTPLQYIRSDERRARGECRNECEDPDAGDCALGVSAVFCQCWSHGLHRAWQGVGRDSHSEKAGPAEPSADRSATQTSRLETETPTAPSLPQGAHAVLEQGTASSALPQALISMLFLFLGGPCNKGPSLAQPEE